jgi:hypothetical protein
MDRGQLADEGMRGELARTSTNLAQREEVETRDSGDDAVATVTEAVADAWKVCGRVVQDRGEVLVTRHEQDRCISITNMSKLN